MHFIANFFAGVFFINFIPHLVSGLLGMPFPSPFGKPPGKGHSSPTVNVVWGLVNLALALMLLATHPVVIGVNADFGVLALGSLAFAIQMSRHFGKVQRENGAYARGRGNDD